jgi:hypothetical protein
MAPSIRCFPRHHFTPPTFLPSLRSRLFPAKARYPHIQAHGVHKKASSKENQGKQPLDSSTDDHSNEDGDSSSSSDLSFLALFFKEYRKASSKENQGNKPSDSSKDDHSNKGGDSSSLSDLYFLALFFFIVGARGRRERREHEKQQDESPVDANGEVDFEGIGD